MPNGRCPKGVANEQRIVALERDMHEVKDAIGQIRDDLLSRLPNWATIVIALLSAIVAGLVTRVLV
ncbi:MAG: hypothetical protein R6V58_00555 [Planctomycetota bacterium]